MGTSAPQDLNDVQLDELLFKLRTEKDAAHNHFVALREQIIPLRKEQDRRRLQESRQRRAARILAGEDETDQAIRFKQ